MDRCRIALGLYTWCEQFLLWDINHADCFRFKTGREKYRYERILSFLYTGAEESVETHVLANAGAWVCLF